MLLRPVYVEYGCWQPFLLDNREQKTIRYDTTKKWFGGNEIHESRKWLKLIVWRISELNIGTFLKCHRQKKFNTNDVRCGSLRNHDNVCAALISYHPMSIHFNGCYKNNTVCAYIVLQRSIQTPDSLCLQNQMNNERGINRIFVSFSRDNSKFHLSALARTHRLIILLTNRFGKTSTCKYSLYMCRT